MAAALLIACCAVLTAPIGANLTTTLNAQVRTAFSTAALDASQCICARMYSMCGIWFWVIRLDKFILLRGLDTPQQSIVASWLSCEKLRLGTITFAILPVLTSTTVCEVAS